MQKIRNWKEVNKNRRTKFVHIDLYLNPENPEDSRYLALIDTIKDRNPNIKNMDLIRYAFDALDAQLIKFNRDPSGKELRRFQIKRLGTVEELLYDRTRKRVHALQLELLSVQKEKAKLIKENNDNEAEELVQSVAGAKPKKPKPL